MPRFRLTRSSGRTNYRARSEPPQIARQAPRFRIAIYRVEGGELQERWVVSDLYGMLEEIRDQAFVRTLDRLHEEPWATPLSDAHPAPSRR